MPGDIESWSPLSIPAVVDVLGGLSVPWWIAGGWALDLFLGRCTRPHADTDVLILRRDLPEVREALRGWDVHAADPPGVLRPWPIGTTLPASVHDIWCRPEPAAPWALQLMVDDTDGEEWVYRRDPRIRRAVSELAGPTSTDELLVLAPEVQLLYKSRKPRRKDLDDFHAVVDVLDGRQRHWLRSALMLVAPQHAWHSELEAAR